MKSKNSSKSHFSNCHYTSKSHFCQVLNGILYIFREDMHRYTHDISTDDPIHAIVVTMCFFNALHEITVKCLDRNSRMCYDKGKPTVSWLFHLLTFQHNLLLSDQSPYEWHLRNSRCFSHFAEDCGRIKSSEALCAGA